MKVDRKTEVKCNVADCAYCNFLQLLDRYCVGKESDDCVNSSCPYASPRGCTHDKIKKALELIKADSALSDWMKL